MFGILLPEIAALAMEMSSVSVVGEKFTDEMLTKMKNGEKIELKYNYFANEQGVAKEITGSTMIKITFEKGK